jgi:hypothetical protein
VVLFISIIKLLTGPSCSTNNLAATTPLNTPDITGITAASTDPKPKKPDLVPIVAGSAGIGALIVSFIIVSCIFHRCRRKNSHTITESSKTKRLSWWNRHRKYGPDRKFAAASQLQHNRPTQQPRFVFQDPPPIARKKIPSLDNAVHQKPLVSYPVPDLNPNRRRDGNSFLKSNETGREQANVYAFPNPRDVPCIPSPTDPGGEHFNPTTVGSAFPIPGTAIKSVLGPSVGNAKQNPNTVINPTTVPPRNANNGPAAADLEPENPKIVAGGYKSFPTIQKAADRSPSSTETEQGLVENISSSIAQSTVNRVSPPPLIGNERQQPITVPEFTVSIPRNADVGLTTKNPGPNTPKAGVAGYKFFPSTKNAPNRAPSPIGVEWGSVESITFPIPPSMNTYPMAVSESGTAVNVVKYTSPNQQGTDKSDAISVTDRICSETSTEATEASEVSESGRKPRHKYRVFPLDRSSGIYESGGFGGCINPHPYPIPKIPTKYMNCNRSDKLPAISPDRGISETRQIFHGRCHDRLRVDEGMGGALRALEGRRLEVDTNINDDDSNCNSEDDGEFYDDESSIFDAHGTPEAGESSEAQQQPPGGASQKNMTREAEAEEDSVRKERLESLMKRLELLMAASSTAIEEK